MSAVAVEQVAWTNQNLAETIDERLLDIARHMPRNAFFWLPGQESPLTQVEGVGRLYCINSGRYAVEVVAELEGHGGQLGFWKEYVLQKRHTEVDTSLHVKEMAITLPEEFEDCPNPDVLADGIRTLHQEFLGSLVIDYEQPATVSSPTDRLPA